MKNKKVTNKEMVRKILAKAEYSLSINEISSLTGLKKAQVIGDNYFSRPTTIIFTVFFPRKSMVLSPHLLWSSFDSYVPLTKLNKASFESSSPLRQSFERVSGELVIFKIVPSICLRLRYDTQKN